MWVCLFFLFASFFLKKNISDDPSIQFVDPSFSSACSCPGPAGIHVHIHIIHLLLLRLRILPGRRFIWIYVYSSECWRESPWNGVFWKNRQSLRRNHVFQLLRASIVAPWCGAVCLCAIIMHLCSYYAVFCNQSVESIPYNASLPEETPKVSPHWNKTPNISVGRSVRTEKAIILAYIFCL